MRAFSTKLFLLKFAAKYEGLFKWDHFPNLAFHSIQHVGSMVQRNQDGALIDRIKHLDLNLSALEDAEIFGNTANMLTLRNYLTPS